MGRFGGVGVWFVWEYKMSVHRILSNFRPLRRTLLAARNLLAVCSCFDCREPLGLEPPVTNVGAVSNLGSSY